MSRGRGSFAEYLLALLEDVMGLMKGKTEGGSGGKRGHSNMDHWVTTAELKDASRRRRRLESKELIATESEEHKASLNE